MRIDGANPSFQKVPVKTKIGHRFWRIEFMFPPFRSLPPVRHGLDGSFISRILQLTYSFVNRYLKDTGLRPRC